MSAVAGPSSSPTQTHHERSDGAKLPRGESSFPSETVGEVPVGVDESVLRALCDVDCGLPLLLERIKETASSASLVSSFLRKRAALEEDYARQLLKLTHSTLQTYTLSGPTVRAGSFLTSFTSFVRTHDAIADNRLRFAHQCTEMADALNDIVREVDRSRKAGKDVGARLEKSLGEAEASAEKAKNRFDVASEDLERLLLSKAGESVMEGTLKQQNALLRDEKHEPGPRRTFGKAMLASKFKTASITKNPAAFAKLEDELRVRTARESDGYAKEVQQTQQLRLDYFNRERPRILRNLKESADEADLGTQYHLTRYAHLMEAVLCQDGLIVSPVTFEDGPGLRASVDSIDNREDFKSFMQAFTVSYAHSGAKAVSRSGAEEEAALARISASSSFVSHSITSTRATSTSPKPASGRATFGIDLGDQMQRDGVEVPRVLEKCAEAIEAHGLDTTGIYRLSGTTSRIQRLKGRLDRDVEGTDLMSDEHLSDINDITGALKAWFRELPEPLMTFALYHGFVDAAKIENDRLRHIRLHERVNELPDPSYATLKYLMGHLDTIAKSGERNQMHASNLAIVFGPTLFRPPPGEEASALSDMTWQCKAIETILRHYKDIFVEAPDESNV